MYDYINPKHYKTYDKEAIDMFEDIYGTEVVRLHCQITALKYRLRIGLKPDQPIERDLEKAKWYENHADKLKEKLKRNEIFNGFDKWARKQTKHPVFIIDDPQSPLQRAIDALKAVEAVIDNTPELNLSDIDNEDISSVDSALTEIHNIVKQVGDLKNVSEKTN